MEVKRYTIETPPYAKGYMELDSEGDWVRYSDIASLLEAAKNVADWDWNSALTNNESIHCENDLMSLIKIVESMT